METLQSVLLSVRSWRLDGVHRVEGLLLASYNTSGQLQVPQFYDLESSLSIQGSCFGLSTAPQVFARVMAPVLAFLHHLGIRLCRSLDDWLILASRPLVPQALDTVFRLCQELGIGGNWEKSNFLPAQSVVCLGVIIDSILFRASPSLPRV